MCPPTPAPENGMTRHGGYIIGLSTDVLCVQTYYVSRRLNAHFRL